jgi:ATP-dependent Clp protease protease subunit
MIHQVLGGARGQASDIILEAKQMQRVKDRLNKILSDNTGHSVDEIERDTDRNNWMFAEDALEYGLIDHIIND